ncbi:unnamed protein product [Oikopleura dioica]|uniref:EGF-like domain-containing protein n=1 Tax=Oikopleura dioica TaxID=34765 RepID=E4YL06_OIKDI|nr:unnamed protein product [Oikopleura dioica]
MNARRRFRKRCDANIRKCKINYGSPVCVCPKGYQLIGYSCRDINECLSSSTSQCESFQNCVNTDGGYYCSDNLTEKCSIKDGQCGIIDQSSKAGKYFSSKTTFSFPWLVVISGHVDRKLVSCLGAVISDGLYVIADFACTGNMKTSSMSVFRLSDKKRLNISFAYNSQEFDVLLVKLAQPMPGMTSCMPEGEHFNQYSQCVSVQLDNKDSFHMNSEYIVNSQTSCDSLSRKFTQLFNGRISGAICAGDSDVGSTCSISRSQSALFCKRCDSCAWSLAGFGKFYGSCSGSKSVRGFSAVENAEKWIRTFTPYQYSHRFEKCSVNKCCDKFSIESKVFEKQTGNFYKTSTSEFLFNLNGAWSNGMTLSGVSQQSFCPEDATWINPVGKKRITTKAKCDSQQKWTAWSSWSDCNCGFGGIGRTKTCLKAGTCSTDRVYQLKNESKEVCKSQKCPKCCSVINFQVAKINSADAIQPRTGHLIFHLTQDLQSGRPIYKSAEGKFFLAYTTGFWVVTDKIGSFDFFYFIEDSAFCPNDVRKGGWEIMVGMNSAADNRISSECMEIPIAHETAKSSSEVKAPATQIVSGCCANYVLTATAIDITIPSISEFSFDTTKPDAKHYNGPSGYKIFKYSSGSDDYFVIGTSANVHNAVCFAKYAAKSQCVDDTSFTWQCKTGGEWKDVTTVKLSCKPTSSPKVLTIQPEQCYSSNGCCCVLQLTGDLQETFTKDDEDSYCSDDKSLKLTLNDNYWVIRKNGKNMFYVKDNGNAECPNLASTKWKRKATQGWVDSTINISCKTADNHKMVPSKSTKTTPAPRKFDTFDYEGQEYTTTTAFDFTTTTGTTMTTTIWEESSQPWAPWSKCSSTCGGVQSRKRYDDEIATEWKPCGKACLIMSEWFEWSPCSEWCGFGVKRRRRVCSLDGKPSDGCSETAFEKQACYEQDCPLLSKLSNCCMFLSISGSSGPLDGSYRISGGNKEGLVYEHFESGFEIYKQQQKWNIGKALKRIDDAPLGKV